MGQLWLQLYYKKMNKFWIFLKKKSLYILIQIVSSYVILLIRSLLRNHSAKGYLI